MNDEKYINDYKINDIEDFFEEKKINFYYILIKYIFKNSFFIYHIPLLFETRNTIIKIIKTKRTEFLSHLNIENINLFIKINYIIKFFLDSNYYYNIFIGIIRPQFGHFNDNNNEDFLNKLFDEENYGFICHNFNENTEDKNAKKSEIIKTNELDKNNTKENKSENKVQNNIENEDLNLSMLSSNVITMNSKKITQNYISEQEKVYNKESNEEKLSKRILKKSEVILNIKKEGEKIVFKFESVSYGDHHILLSYEKLLDIKKYLEKSENKISKSFIKYMEFLEEFKDRISKEFEQGYKLKIGLEFQIIDEAENDSIFNMDCIYKIYSPNSDISFREKNILLNKTNSDIQGFMYLVNEINENEFQEISQKETNKKSVNNNKNDPNKRNNPDDIDLSDVTKEFNLFSCSESKEENVFNLKMRASNYQILKIIGIVDEVKKENNVEFKKELRNEHFIRGGTDKIKDIAEVFKTKENNVEFIKELSNGYYVSGGTDNIVKIFDHDFSLKKKLTNIDDWIYSCLEIEKLSNKNENENDYIELILCCFKKLYKYILSFEKEEVKIIGYLKYKIPSEIKSCVQITEKNFAIFGQNCSYLTDLFNSEKSQIKKDNLIPNISFLGSIKINRNIIAITSNKVQYKGEDKLIFYNVDKNEISDKIEGYSFISEINGLALMPREEVKAKNKILLCACKKYFDDQRNGIYLANLQLDDKEGINKTSYDFYNTGNFEVFCFCPNLIINPDNNILEKENEKKIIDTEYFFVGGFNLDKREGEIKLFKVIFDEKDNNYKIEFVQDIEFERNKDFTGFEGAVSCITQTKKENNGYILVTCYSGKIYLLTQPNLNYYLKTTNN